MRILIIDDEPRLLSAYKQIFENENHANNQELKSLEDDLFGEDNNESPIDNSIDAEISYAKQGLEGVSLVKQSIADKNPYQLAFIDFRMPPGIDGAETARLIRAIDSEINIVIVSAFADKDIQEITKIAGPAHKIFFIAKPFSVSEIKQMALSLNARWHEDKVSIENLQEQIIKLKESEARAIHLANHDTLTGAPNRHFFNRELAEKLNRPNANFAVAVFDLDRFKSINDKYGHTTGDDLINSIFKSVRASLPDDVFLARIGGDAFGLLMENYNIEKANIIAQNIIEICRQPFKVFATHIQTSASVGLLHSTQIEKCDANEIMRWADIALYSAKSDGRDRVCVFNKKLDESIRFRQTILTGLTEALKNGELVNNYQPIVDKDNLKIAGFEALLRWHSKEHGMISPGIFVPIAEDSDLIFELGDWVIRRALLDCKNWPNQYVSINCSPKQFKRMEFVEFLCEAAKEAEVPHEKIQIEITETAIFDDVDHAKQVLQKFHDLGFRIALDDFGTGYSSLVSVRNFAIDCIKIDKSFVQQIGLEKHSNAIVQSISILARTLGLNVVAEGVETEHQCQALRILGCSHLQGYLFGKAIGPAEALELAKRDTPIFTIISDTLLKKVG